MATPTIGRPLGGGLMVASASGGRTLGLEREACQLQREAVTTLDSS